MSNFRCPECNTEIVDNYNGLVTGCEHFNLDDLMEYSGKLISDSIPREKADWEAVQSVREQLQKGKQISLF